MQISELCNLIDLPEVVTDKVIKYEKEIDFTSIEPEMALMNNSKTWERAIEELTKLIAPDETGLKLLTCQMHAACNIYEKYMEKGISEDIFIDTMKFFSDL